MNNVSNQTEGSADGLPLRDLEQYQVKDRSIFNFEIKTLRLIHAIPLPAEVDSLNVDGGGMARPNDDGTYDLIATGFVDDVAMIHGTGFEPNSNFKPAEAYKGVEMQPFLSKDRIPARVQRLADTVAAAGKTDYDKASLISAKISNLVTYNLDAAATPQNQDPVEYTLFEEKEGYCTAFASAMVLMARSVGIPARYVQGYRPDDRRRDNNGTYLITDQDYHAWAELFFKGAGWVTFDPSLSANAKSGEGLGDAGDDRPWYQRGAVLVLLDCLIFFAVIGLAIVAVRQLKSYKRTMTTRTELERTVIAFNRTLERAAGKRRMVGQTPNEFVASIQAGLGGCYDSAKDLNERFVQAMYSSDSVGADVVASLRVDMLTFRSMLKLEVRKARKKQS
jgi:hypothetical protein